MVQDKIYNYFERNSDLHVLFIFDTSGVIAEELSDVQWKDGYRYLEPKGSWFSIKRKVDTEWKSDNIVMLFRQLSPASVKQDFPLMDLLKANMEYHSQDYTAFMQQHNIPGEFASFVSSHMTELQSQRVMDLIKPFLADRSFSADVAIRAFIASYLDKAPKIVPDWTTIIIRLILLGAESEEQKRTTFFNKLGKNMDAYRALDAQLVKIFGTGLQLNTIERVNAVAQLLKYNAITQSLPVSQADNYKQLRINDGIALQNINRIMEQAFNDPRRSEAFRAVLNTLAKDIREEEIVNTYGVDANYWYISPSMAWAILKTVIDERLSTEPQSAIYRISEIEMKCGLHEQVADVVEFAKFVAHYYETAKSIKSFRLNQPDDYISKYCTEYYLLDYFYRKAVNKFYAIDDSIHIFSSIENVKNVLDVEYHKLANRINLEWIDCLKQTGGFARLSLTRQQDFYDKYVKDLPFKVVVVISDALRYEVAQQLIERLTANRHPAKMEAALAMLPTETCYCKPSLLPHSTLHLEEAEKMLVDGELLPDTSTREKSLQRFKENALCKQFSTLMSNSRGENREIFKRDVVYVFHNTIDESSHHNKPAKTITDSCEQAVDELAKLVKSLHASWNATHVVITSDHGFIFNDIKFEDKDKQPVNEETIERKSRYYITKSDAAQSNIMKFPLKEVSGLDNDDLFVAVPIGTNRLYAPAGDYVFAHGGASLQELIIPVIVSHRLDEERREQVSAIFLDSNLRMVSSRVKFTLLQTEPVSLERRERTLICSLYDGDNQVSQPVTVTLNKADIMLDARKFPVELTLNKPTTASVLNLRIYDIEDELNPYLKTNVTNNTLIQMDF